MNTMKMINDIFAFILSLLLTVGASPLFYTVTFPDTEENDIRFIENTTVNAVQTPVRTVQYQPDILILSFVTFIFCSKSEPIENYADWPKLNLNSPLRAFKFTFGQFTADY